MVLIFLVNTRWNAPDFPDTWVPVQRNEGAVPCPNDDSGCEAVQSGHWESFEDGDEDDDDDDRFSDGDIHVADIDLVAAENGDDGVHLHHGVNTRC